MRALALIVLIGVAALAAVACASDEPATPCADGDLWTEYQLFMGRNSGDTEVVTDEAWKDFLAAEVTPRFPNGLTVLDADGQWRGDDNVILRERSKVLLILAPPDGDARARIDEVADAYTSRFRQDSVLITTKESCVTFS